MSIELGLIFSAISVVLGVITFFIGRTTAAKNDGTQIGLHKNDFQHMKKTVERTEEKVDNQSKILSDLSTDIKLIKREQEIMWENISELKKNPRD